MKESQTDIMIITAPCWQCNKDMRIALAGDNAGNLFGGPEGFSESEIKVATHNGVHLKIVTSKTSEETYLANVCRECGAFIGQFFFFFAHYYTPALYGHYAYMRPSHD